MDINSDSLMHSGGQVREIVQMHTPVRKTGGEYKYHPVSLGTAPQTQTARKISHSPLTTRPGPVSRATQEERII